MTEEEIKDLQAKLEILTQNVSALVDQKAALEAVNKRLANAVAELTIEKSNLEQKLKRFEGMGIQQNNPGTFATLKSDAGKPSRSS